MGYLEEVKQVGKLETFDPEAFNPSPEWPKDICDFILALSAASNDLRDTFMCMYLLREDHKKNSDGSDIRYVALSGGVTIALRRLMVGVIHELLRLVKANANSIDSGAFRSIYQDLSRRSKEAWDRIWESANSKPVAGTLGRALLMCRNKVGFHYDAAQIGKAYRKRFCVEESKGPPVVSRGQTMRSRRFYFSDAAVEAFIGDIANDPEIEKLFMGQGELLEDINRSLYEIVVKFINKRGFAFREYRHGTERA